MRFSNKEKAQECRRELGQRRHVYKRRVEERKMKAAAADHLIAVMEDMLADYERLDALDRPDLFSDPAPTSQAADGVASKLRAASKFGETPERQQLMRVAADLLEHLSAPVPGVRGKRPLVCYFENDTDRDEFIAAVLAVKPNMRCEKV